jgi:hypothetical protein
MKTVSSLTVLMAEIFKSGQSHFVSVLLILAVDFRWYNHGRIVIRAVIHYIVINAAYPVKWVIRKASFVYAHLCFLFVLFKITIACKLRTEVAFLLLHHSVC